MKKETFISFLALIGLLSRAGVAQVPPPPPATQPAIDDDLKGVGLIEHRGAQLPLDVTFEDDSGQTFPLGHFFNHGRPVVLQLGYFSCPMLCGLVSQGMVNALKPIDLRGGKDYDVIFLSIDPGETSSLSFKKKESFIKAMGRPDEAAAWHLLTGKESHIRQVTDAAGFMYKWIEREHQFAHPSGLIILSPDGRISRYLGGVDYDPKTVRYSLIEASQGKVGTLSDTIWLTCFHYDASTGKYTLAATNLVRAGGALTVLVLGFTIYRFLRRERLQRANSSQTS